MIDALFNAIINVFTKITDFIFSFLNFPAVPVELSNAVSFVFEKISSGMGIVNFFLPIEQIKPALVCFLAIFTIEHSFTLIMFVIRKIPFLNIK